MREMQDRIDAWIGRFEEGYFSPLANLARLVEEVGELAREINHAYGEKPKKPTEAPSSLALELGDILFVVGALANSLDIDLTDALEQVMQKYESRDADRWRPRQ